MVTISVEITAADNGAIMKYYFTPTSLFFTIA